MRRPCDVCGASYEAKRATSKYCGPTCRMRASRGHTAATGPSEPVLALPGADSVAGEVSTRDAVLRELAAVGRQDTSAGAAALALARRIDESTAVMGFAMLVKELRATMAAALEGTTRTADALDELRERRARRTAG